MSHLLLLATDLQENRGGIASVNLALLKNLYDLCEAGETLRVLSLHDTPEWLSSLLAELSAEKRGVPIRFKACKGNNFLFALMSLRWASGARRIVAGHVRLATPLLLLPSVMGRLVVFGHGSEVTHAIRDSSRWVLERAGLVLANSNRTANRIRIVSGELSPIACPLGLTRDTEVSEVGVLPRLKNVAGVEEILGDQVLLLVGRMDSFERRKGHQELLESLPELLRGYPDVQMVFAGPGTYQTALAEQAMELGLADHVFIDGPLPRSELNALFQHCFAFVMPSQQEGFGMVYLEAMHFSKACLGCRNDGAEEIIVHEQTGLLLDSQDDLHGLIASLEWLLCDPERTAEMGRQGFARLQTTFTSRQFDERFRQALGASK